MLQVLRSLRERDTQRVEHAFGAPQRALYRWVCGVVTSKEHAVDVHWEVVTSDVMGGNGGEGMTHLGPTDEAP